MRNTIKQVVKRIIYGPLSSVMAYVFQFISNLEYHYFTKKWERTGWKKPDQTEIDFVRENVTIIFKSFERQKMLSACTKTFNPIIRESALLLQMIARNRLICRTIHYK